MKIQWRLLGFYWWTTGRFRCLFIVSSSHKDNFHRVGVYGGINGPKLKYDTRISSKTSLTGTICGCYWHKIYEHLPLFTLNEIIYRECSKTFFLKIGCKSYWMCIMYFSVFWIILVFFKTDGQIIWYNLNTKSVGVTLIILTMKQKKKTQNNEKALLTSNDLSGIL